jgi:metal-sulfur cluster biosynthetic enzyme/rhodanese-related sulfurtransferase
MGGVNAKMPPMLSVVWGLAIVALAVLVWQLSQRLRAAERQLAEMRSQRRQLDESRAQLERSLAVARMHLADVAAGEAPPRDVILRGAAYRPIEPAPALVLVQQQPDLFVLDVRTPAEFASGHIPGAHLIPVDELEDRLAELPARDHAMLVTCAAGGRSTMACELLAERGWTRMLNLAGGMHAWTGPRERDEAAAAPPPPPPGALTGTTVNYRGGAVEGAQVVDAIRECYDPEIPLNIYDLGLIYGIDIDPEKIAIRMTLTSEGCPSARQIPEDVRRRVAALGQPNVSVDVVFDPPWHPTRISEEGKSKLGIA